MKGVKYLTQIGEGLVFLDWSERDHYFFMRLSKCVYLVVRIGMELPTKKFFGGDQGIYVSELWSLILMTI
jgi:hypothetical protein